MRASFSLTTPHAKHLAAIATLEPFEQIETLYALLVQAAELDSTLRERLSQNINELRKSGALWDEMAERTGLPAPLLVALAPGRP